MTEQRAPRDASAPSARTLRSGAENAASAPAAKPGASGTSGTTLAFPARAPQAPQEAPSPDDAPMAEVAAGADARLSHFTELVIQAARGLQATLTSIDATLPPPESAWTYDPSAQQATLHHLRGELGRLRALVADLHALTPVVAATGLAWIEPVEVGDLLMSILPRWKTRAPQAMLELALPGETPTILAESALVEQAIDALLTFMVARASSGDTIRVSIRPRPECVLVSLRDHGRPVGGEALSALFEPESITRVGLSLALARAIVEAHGGTVWAEQPETGGGLALVAAWPMLPPGRRLANAASREDAIPSGGTASAREPVTADAVPPEKASPPLALRPPRARALALVAHLDTRMARYLRANLEEDQCQVVLAASQAEALRLIAREEPDIILCDGELCGVGLDGLRQVHAATSAPVLVLPRRADPGQCARMLDLGARDVLGSPFAMEELLARTRAALRERAARKEEESEPHYVIGELEIDVGERRVCREGQPIALSKTEFKLLRTLAAHAGMVLAHDVLLERVWGPAYGREVGFLWVYIRRLRRKIEPDPTHPRYILTVPGIGYRLSRDGELPPAKA